MRSLRLVALFVFCLLPALYLTAQAPIADQPGSASATQAPDPDNGLSGPIQGLFIPDISGQPFRTRATLELTRQLADGSTVEQKSYMYIARDSNGRVYREGRELVPAGSDLEPSLLRKIVYDPKTLLKFTCTPERKVCTQITYNPALNPTVEPTGPAQDGKSVLERKDLGTKTIEGLQAIGTREIRTYSPGAFGNDKPVVVTREIWFSPQLQINLSVTRMDPRSGTQKIETVDLKLGEPAADWFAIPDGYRTVAERTLSTKALNPELEPLIEKDVPGIAPDELRNDLAPVEAAIGVYAKAHASASPNDKNDAFAGQLRQRLASDFHMMQQNTLPQVPQSAQTDQRLNVDFQQVVTSPCLNKPAPGDPATMPKDEASLREEQRAWLAVRDAWTAFLVKLFPHADPANFAWRITSERDSDIRRIQTVLRNRGCNLQESLVPLLAGMVPSMSEEQLATAAKPVETAIGDFVKAHAAASPNDKSDQFANLLRQRLSSNVRMMQQNNFALNTQTAQFDQLLNADYQQVVSSACLGTPAPGDPATMPKDEASLREEQRAWIALRDAWTVFLGNLFPNADRAGFAWQITLERDAEFKRMETVLRNRGCAAHESIALQLAGVISSMNAAQLAAAVKPVDVAIDAYAKAHAESAPRDRNNFIVNTTQQNLIADLRLRQQGQIPTRDQFEVADLHLNQAYRAIVGSPCLGKPATTDPPNAPVSEEKLRAEERAWIGVRDAWTAFMTQLYPGDTHTGLGTTLTDLRTNELRQMQGVMKNRGCKSDDSE
jgi:uncharacterized protein YecT (DUF1311 family)